MSYIPLDIPRRGGKCAKNQEPFLPGDTYFSHLDDNFGRWDYCPSCWTQEGKKTFWISRVPEKNRDEKKNDKTEIALATLSECLEQNLFKKAFILALFLARKKVLILREELVRNGIVVSLYEVRATEEMIEVPKVKIELSEIPSLQREIACVL